jgi:DNA-binding transcriptional regulator YdaS (Cro superfamily)
MVAYALLSASMRKTEAIKHFGTATAMASALGIGKATVSKWGDEVPPRYQYELERITKRKLRAQWPPSDRPLMTANAS